MPGIVQIPCNVLAKNVRILSNFAVCVAFYIYVLFLIDKVVIPRSQNMIV